MSVGAVNVTPGGQPPPGSNPVDNLRTMSQKVNKKGKCYRTKQIAERALMGLGIAFGAIAAASLCFSGLVPIATPITLAVAIIAGTISAASLLTLRGVPIPEMGNFAVCKKLKEKLCGIRKSRERNEEVFQKQFVQLLFLLKGQEPPANSLAARVLKRHGSRLKKMEIDFSEEIRKKDAHWSKDEVEGLFKTIGKYCKNVKNLELKQAEGLENVNLTPLKQCRNLESLKVTNSDIDDTHLQAIASLKKVKNLQLVDCWRVSAQGLNHLEKWPLKTLNLEGTFLKGFDSRTEQLQKLFMGMQSKQQSDQIYAKKKAKIENETVYKPDPNDSQQVIDAKAAAKAEALKQAESLAWHRANRQRYHLLDKWQQGADPSKVIKTEASDLAVLQKFKKLKDLTVSHIDDSVLEQQIPHLKKLKWLRVSHSSTMTGQGLRAFKPLKCLEEIRFGSCSALEPEALRYLHRNHTRQLQRVTFDWNLEKYATIRDKARWKQARQQLGRNFRQIADNAPKRLKGEWRK